MANQLEIIENRDAIQNHLVKRCLWLARVLSIAAIVFPFLATVGWILEIEFLKQGYPTFPAMQPNTAFGLVLVATIILISGEGALKAIRSLSLVASLVVISLGLLTLSEYLMGLDFGIDRIFIDVAPTTMQPFPGRPSPQASLNFVFIGIGLFFNNLSTPLVRVSQACALFVGINSIVAFTGYIFRTEEFYGFPYYVSAIGIAIPTAIAFLLLVTSLLCSRPRDGMMSLVTSETQSGGMARRILFAGIIVPPLIGALTRIGVAIGLYDVSAQISLFAIAIVGLIIRVTWKAARYAEKNEMKEKNALEESRSANEKLKKALVERQMLADTLRLTEAKASGIVSISVDAIICIDENQRITLFNEGAEKIFGHSESTMIGESLDILIPERVREIHRQHIERFSREDLPARRMGERDTPILGVRKNGEEFPADAAISKIEIGGTKIFTVALRDITDQRRREDQLQRAIKTREDILAIVSHDLKNPVSVIGLTAQLLHRVEKSDIKRIHDFADKIQRSTEQMQQLIGDLLDFSKIESGTFSVDVYAENLISVLRPVVDGVRTLTESRKQILDDRFTMNLPEVACDAARIGQVMSNLLGNAIKFTPEGGVIRVFAIQKDDSVVVTVSDTGPGIPSSQLSKIFDRYWQPKETQGQGSGLGLSIAKGIIEAHKGRIWAESILGEGTRFHFTIPLVTSATPRRAISNNLQTATVERGSTFDSPPFFKKDNETDYYEN